MRPNWERAKSRLQLAAPVVQDQWVESIGPASEAPYYYNHTAAETTWNKPAGFGEVV
jgi:hypothetical protein